MFSLLSFIVSAVKRPVPIFSVQGKPVCLVCGYALAVMKKANVERHYTSKHAKFIELQGEMRQDKINALQGMFESQQIAFTRPCDRDNVSSKRSKSSHHFRGSLSSEQVRLMASHSPVQLLEMVKSVVPKLHNGMHKGQAGRVAVIGGCQEYTGAPYFAAISALKVGADLSHVFCSADSATVIKGYSPELIVHPLLDSPDAIDEISKWLPRFHSLVVGPGLGRDSHILKTAHSVIQKAIEAQIPLVIDADGLFLVTQDPSLVEGYTNIILTPNTAEFERLYRKVFERDPNPEEPIISVNELCRKLGHITIVHKGLNDIISNGVHVLVCTEPGSPRRCGGQGDLLSGSMGIFAFWSAEALKKKTEGSLLQTYGSNLCAAYAACVLTRVCNKRAFEVSGRSMVTSDMISQIHNSFNLLF